MQSNSIIPMLPVRSMPASLEFYQKLGFTVVKRQDAWGWAMLAYGDSRLMIDQSINVHPGAPKQGVLYLYPTDIEKYHEQLRTNGIKVPELDDTFYQMREFRIEDPDGNRLWIGQVKQP